MKCIRLGRDNVFLWISTKSFQIIWQNFIFTDICDSFCENGGTCTVEDGKPKCLCPSEFKGDKCEKRKQITELFIHIYFIKVLIAYLRI